MPCLVFLRLTGFDAAQRRLRPDRWPTCPIPLTVFGAPPDKTLLAESAAAGADRCLLTLAHLDASQTLAGLDDWARLNPA